MPARTVGLAGAIDPFGLKGGAGVEALGGAPDASAGGGVLLRVGVADGGGEAVSLLFVSESSWKKTMLTAT